MFHWWIYKCIKNRRANNRSLLILVSHMRRIEAYLPIANCGDRTDTCDSREQFVSPLDISGGAIIVVVIVQHTWLVLVTGNSSSANVCHSNAVLVLLINGLLYTSPLWTTQPKKTWKGEVEMTCFPSNNQRSMLSMKEQMLDSQSIVHTTSVSQSTV